jgi:integrase
MPKMKLTAAAVERIKPPASGRIEYFDAAYPGLALRVTERGVKSWVYFGRVHGKLKRATLGRWPTMKLGEAREAAGDTADAMSAGQDPAEAKRKARREAQAAARDTINAVAAEWLKRDQAGNRSHDEVKRIIERDVLGAWGGRHIKEITRRDAIELIDAIADRGAVTMARRVQTHIHRLFRWAVARGIVDASPVIDLPKPGRVVKRDRVLNDNELARVWAAAEAVGWPFGEIVRLLLLTGARRSEIGRLEWGEVDLDWEVIHIDGTRTKNGEPHDIPLSQAAVDIVTALPHIADADGNDVPHVFTTTGDAPVSGWSRAKLMLHKKDLKLRRDAADAAGDDPDAVEPLAEWRLHDLRRTVATGMQRLGVRIEVTEAVLGHVSGSRRGIVGVYQRHDYAEEKRAALIAWADHVAKITGGTPASVISIRGAR